MKFDKRILLSGIILFFIIDGMCSVSLAENRLFDIHANLTEKYAALSFELSEKPSLQIGVINHNNFHISINDIKEPEELRKKIKKLSFLTMTYSKKAESIDFHIALKKAFNKVRCAWVTDKNVLYLDFEFLKEGEKYIENNTNTPVLKDILFGFKKKAVRMVIGASRNPSWEIRQYGHNTLSLIIDSTSKIEKTRTYNPEKWLKKVVVNSDIEGKTDLSLQTDSTLNQINIFWMELGKRLVFDLFNTPEESLVDSMPFKAVCKTETGHKDNAYGILNGPGHQKYNNIVRMKISQNDIPDSRGDTKNRGAEQIDKSQGIKPQFKSNLPTSKKFDVDLNSLSPEEAFLFGRIRQAKDISDYDKGIILADQFLKKFQNSSINKVISFWRADFYYDLWEKGDKDKAKNVLQAYQYAINRFQDPGRTSIAYIKMARVTSQMGNNFQALGYLGIVISEHNPDFLPIAYLTRGKIFLQMNEPENAIKDFKILLQDFPESKFSMEANLWLADYYHKMGLYEEAEEKLNQIDKKYPDLFLKYPKFILLNAKNDLYLKKYKEARKYLFKAVNIGGQQETVDLLLTRIGDTYHNENNWKEAEKFYRMVIDYYPGSEGASIAKLRLADYFSDISILQGVSKEKSNEPIGDLAILEKGYQLYEQKQYDGTINALKELVSKPIETETRKDAKRLYINAIEKEIVQLRKAGRNRELIDLFKTNRLMLNNKMDPEVRYQVARAYSDMKMPQEAFSIYNQIKTYDLSKGTRGEFILSLAKCYMANGDTDGAMSLLEKSRNEKLQPIHVQEINLLLADIYKSRDKNKEAIQLYQQVVNNIKELPPDEMARAYLNLGITFNRRKQYSDARNALNHSIDTCMDNNGDSDVLRSAYIELGNVLYSEGRNNLSVKAFEKGFSLGYGTDKPDYWENRFRLALAYIRIGQREKAEKLLNDISEDGGNLIQERAQIKLGELLLDKQLRLLSIGEK